MKKSEFFIGNFHFLEMKLSIYLNRRVFVMYRVFNYFKHHVYYVSINNFIYYVSINDFLKQHVYNNMLFISLIVD